jgi:plastocyanin
MKGVILSIAAMLVLAACSSSGSSSPSASAAAASCAKPDANGIVKISAQNISFDTNCIEVPAGQAFKIEFSNNDNVPHDVAIYNDSSKSTEIMKGDIIDGGKTATYEVPALEAGEHYFECTVHPNMNGKVTAS